MKVDYLGLVKETLTERWSNPPFIEEKDFQTGVQLFTKLAVLSTHQAERSSLSGKEISQESEPLEGTTEAIKKFVKKYSFQFRQVCSSGFPFSKLDLKTSERVLEKALKSPNSIIIHLLEQDGSVELTEKELEEKYQEVFEYLNIGEVGKACSDLKRAYTSNNDKRAGYYLLWLIKHSAGCNFEIPSKDTFDESTVKTVLTKFVAGKSSALKHPANFLDLLHFKKARINPAMYQDLLEYNCHSLFLNFTVNQLRSIPMATWPNKGSLITGLLETLTTESKTGVAKELETSTDPVTSKVGHHILKALSATSMKTAIPHYYALTELLSHFTHSHVEIIFGRPFESFLYDTFTKYPDFTRRLTFNGMGRVFISGNLMIGVYDTRTTYGGRGVPPHLLAYNMKTERLEWGIPLNPTPIEDLSLNPTQSPMISGFPQMGPAGYDLNRVGEDITLQLVGQQNVHFINPRSGEIKTSIALPYKKRDESDRLHLTPNGFGYQVINLKEGRKLIGGKISDSKLDPAFEVATPRGRFLPLSTHMGFFQDFKNKLVLFSPTGESVTLDCLSAKAYGNKLYLIEPNPTVENTCKLTIRTMTADDSVVTAPEKTIILKVKKASIDCLCDNEQMILSCSNKSPIFVSLDSEEVVYSKCKIEPYAKQVINTATGELWSWDESSEKIWKISSKETVLMGSLVSGRGTTLLHVDESNLLYFVDIPY